MNEKRLINQRYVQFKGIIEKDRYRFLNVKKVLKKYYVKQSAVTKLYVMSSFK